MSSNALFRGPWRLGGSVPSSFERRQMPRGYTSLDLDAGGGKWPSVVHPRGYSPDQEAAGKAYLNMMEGWYKKHLGRDVKGRTRYAGKIDSDGNRMRGRAGTNHLEAGFGDDPEFLEKFRNDPEAIADYRDIVANSYGGLQGAQIGLSHGGLGGRDKGAHWGGTNEVEQAQRVMEQAAKAGYGGATPGFTFEGQQGIIPNLPERKPEWNAQVTPEAEATLGLQKDMFPNAKMPNFAGDMSEPQQLEEVVVPPRGTPASNRIGIGGLRQQPYGPTSQRLGLNPNQMTYRPMMTAPEVQASRLGVNVPPQGYTPPENRLGLPTPLPANVRASRIGVNAPPGMGPQEVQASRIGVNVPTQPLPPSVAGVPQISAKDVPANALMPTPPPPSPKEYYKMGTGTPDGVIDRPDLGGGNALFGWGDPLPSWADEAFGFEWGE